mmetsp:Transcript_97040/g.230930  ORF Transcript_97040/g.230930 Transcript_97040/m.230930 type:complete len:140 (-) Transcript_97040:1197-1616(-)
MAALSIHGNYTEAHRCSWFEEATGLYQDTPLKPFSTQRSAKLLLCSWIFRACGDSGSRFRNFDMLGWFIRFRTADFVHGGCVTVARMERGDAQLEGLPSSCFFNGIPAAKRTWPDARSTLFRSDADIVGEGKSPMDLLD